MGSRWKGSRRKHKPIDRQRLIRWALYSLLAVLVLGAMWYLWTTRLGLEKAREAHRQDTAPIQPGGSGP